MSELLSSCKGPLCSAQENSDGAVSGMVCLTVTHPMIPKTVDDQLIYLNQCFKDLHTNHMQNLLLLPRLTSDKLVNAIDICYMKSYCKFSLNKEELHNHTWSKLHCDEPLSANALISALKLAFYFLYILSQTFKWWYMDSIASWCDSIKCWKNEGFDEIMLRYV